MFFVLSANNLSTYVRENIGLTVLVSDDMKQPEALKFQLRDNRMLGYFGRTFVSETRVVVLLILW